VPNLYRNIPASEEMVTSALNLKAVPYFEVLWGIVVSFSILGLMDRQNLSLRHSVLQNGSTFCTYICMCSYVRMYL